jgi:hypothetical protein
MSGHVATTIMVAQIIESRKGNRIQMLTAMSVPMQTMDSVTRLRSRVEGIDAMNVNLCDGRENGLVANFSFSPVHRRGIWQ